MDINEELVRFISRSTSCNDCPIFEKETKCPAFRRDSLRTDIGDVCYTELSKYFGEGGKVNKRRKHNAQYSILDTVTGKEIKGTLKELSVDTKIPMTTITTNLNLNRLIYRRYKVTFLG